MVAEKSRSLLGRSSGAVRSRVGPPGGALNVYRTAPSNGARSLEVGPLGGNGSSEKALPVTAGKRARGLSGTRAGTLPQTQPVGFGAPATLQAPCAGPSANNSYMRSSVMPVVFVMILSGGQTP